MTSSDFSSTKSYDIHRQGGWWVWINLLSVTDILKLTKHTILMQLGTLAIDT